VTPEETNASLKSNMIVNHPKVLCCEDARAEGDVELVMRCVAKTLPERHRETSAPARFLGRAF